MKKILSLTLVALMMVSMIPTAHAITTNDTCSDCGSVTADGVCPTCDGDVSSNIPEVGTTTVTLVGTEEAAGSYYEVEVPASMAPGDSADITVTGTWKSNETLKVTAPDKVTLVKSPQSIDVAITFAGINQVGNDLTDSSATATLKLADASVKFGTWTGVIEYTVELVEKTPSPLPASE